MYIYIYIYTGQFISPSGTSEISCATTKTDTAERSISIGRESLQVFFCVLSVVAYLQVSPLGGSRDETWRGQGIRKRSVSWNFAGLTSSASPRVDISSTCRVGQKLGVSLPLLTCSPSAWPSRLLYRRGRKFRRDLWITLYIYIYMCVCVCVCVCVCFNDAIGSRGSEVSGVITENKGFDYRYV